MDYISFIDADDIPHYQRNEILIKTITENNSDIILHNFMTNNQTFNQITEFNYKSNVLCKAPSGCITHIKFDDECIYKIHHAQATVKKSICDKILYDESESMVEKADCVFCYAIFSLPNITHTYIYNELSYYLPSYTCINQNT